MKARTAHPPNHVVPALPDQIKTWEAASQHWAAWASEHMEPRRGRPGWFSLWTRLALNAAAAGLFRVEFTEREVVFRGPRGPHGTANDDKVIWHQFRAAPEEVAEWTRCAEAEGLERAEWCRQVLDAAAKTRELFRAA